MYVFGSSRIGVDKTLRTDDRNPGIFIYHKDLTTTHYEISNHLGNVLTTVTGRKLGQVQNEVLDHYLPEVVTATDYYAFGAQMPGRTYENTTLSGTNGYRYAFNGKELDKSGEWGSLNHYDYGFRIYNPSIGKFLSVDPLAKKFTSWSPYNYALNNPIRMIDPDGRAAVDVVDGNPIKGFFLATGAYFAGVANAVGSNSLLGAGRQDPSTFGEYASYAQAGLTSGDLISVIQGGLEMAVGAGGTAVATGTGVGVVATPATVGIAVHGAATTGTAMSNLLNPTKLEARGQNRIPDTGGPPGGIQSNKPNTTIKKYNKDGKVVKEWNKGHPDHPKNSKNYKDHIHDYKTPGDKNSRQPARTPKKNEVMKDFRPKKVK